MNLNQNIKVKDALRRGQNRINYVCVSVAIVFLAVVPLFLVFVFRNDQNNIVLITGGISSVLIGIFFPFYWWLKETVRYKIWAGKNVKDIHRFYEEALSKKYITEHKFLKKFELKSNKQKEELKRFFNDRLDKKREIIRDINADIARETVFKSNNMVSIIIWIVLMIGAVYLKYTESVNDRMVYFTIVAGAVLIAYELYKMFKYKYILKINKEYISYKDNKEKIFWKDIQFFNIVRAGQYKPGELNIITSNESYSLALEGIVNNRLNKVLDVLNENKHRFEINNFEA